MSTPESWKETARKASLPGYKTFMGSIEKPDVDRRDYRVIELENGLRAVVIHDPTADKAAACVSVHVGHLNDPVDVPGMAHFTEHMITKGSKPFPAFNEIMMFITSNGGTRNASTGPSGATYWFSIGPNLLTEAVRRLAAAFHSPLFPPEVTAREIHAVDSENKRNLQDDDRRINQVNRSLSAPDHPWNKFGTGNFESLTEAARQKVKAGEEGADEDDEKADDGGAVGREVVRRMAEWREQEYCAGRLTFAVLGKESLDELTELTVREFSPVPNRNVDPRPSVNDYPWSENQQSCAIFVETVKDLYRIDLSFPIPCSIPHFRTKPANYITHFLGHEGPGSVCAYLKHRGWLLSLSASPQTWNRGIEVFRVSCKLTVAGYKNYQEVVKTLFNYISILKTSFPLPAYHFDEMKKMSEISFQNKEKVQTHTYAIRVAAQVATPHPTSWLLNANSMYRDWDPEPVKAVLDCLIPEKARVMLMAKKHDKDVVGKDLKWETEKWYGTQYSIKKFDSAFIEKLKEANVNESLFLPVPNPFIPTNLHVDRVEGPKLEGPECIHRSQLSTLWYKKDDQFFVPKGDVYIALKTRLAYATPRHAVLTSLFIKLLDDALSEITYDASISGLWLSITNHSEGLDIRIHGYNDKLSVLLDMVLDNLKNIDIQQNRLDVFIEELKRAYDNFPMNKPVEHSSFYSGYLLKPLQWTPEEKSAELEGIRLSDLKQHQEALLSKLKIEVLVSGNFRKEEALEILGLTERRLACKALSAAEQPLSRSLILPEGANFIYQQQVYDPKELNSAIIVYYHFGDVADQRLRAKLDLLVHVIREPAFTELRTNQQLGYIVSTPAWSSTGTIGLRVQIQSLRDPTFLQERIEEFLLSFESRLREMSEEDFASQKEGLIVKKVEKHKNLAEESSAFWNEIGSGYFDFARDTTDAEVVKALTKDEVLDTYTSFLHPNSTTRRRLAVHLLSQHLDKVLPIPEGAVRVDDLHDFKASLPCSPAAKPVAGSTVALWKSSL